jgi:uncharacterized tellurite resistance protein B-like protein|tara:strand:- start:94 stop:513 length:420 start_codon:yes stop_codon:yes gene_type:complete
MFKKIEDKIENIIKVAALLIHAAKIDENYSLQEEKIIKKTLLKLGASNENIEKIVEEGESIESNSNQILDFTREVKNMSDDNKVLIIETLWKIIYSNNVADMYETSLMRRLAGLLYIDNKIMGNIKEKIKKQIQNDLYS